MSGPLVLKELVELLDATMARVEAPPPSRFDVWNVISVVALRALLQELAAARELDARRLSAGRLFRAVPGFSDDERDEPRERLLGLVDADAARRAVARLAPERGWLDLPIEAFGQLYESLLAARPSERWSLRKLTGSYYTPQALTELVVARAFATDTASSGEWQRKSALAIVDPALGAGAFLLQAARFVARTSGRPLGQLVRHELFGADVSPLAVAVAEASLWLLANEPELELASAGANLEVGDSLCEPEVARALNLRGVNFWRRFSGSSFDLVLGNPPWVAFAGRAAQPLSAGLRELYRARYRSFRGYPTLHGLFTELSTRLAPQGVIALLIPSPVADLAGYRHVRSTLAGSHAVCEPLLELGQDVFASVTQPCFALVAEPRREPARDPERSFVLSERARATQAASQLRPPPALEALQDLPRLPAALFGEMGFQTTSRVTRELLFRGDAPPAEYSYPLHEGRDVAEFSVRGPRLFLKPDREVLQATRCRLRAASDYNDVKVVVRQTASITIAALHDGKPFRNSLLAGFELPGYPPTLLLGLLNSQLYRALHLVGRRDARQGVFPQVKIAHLRALPAPVRRVACDRIAFLAAQASAEGLTVELRARLDSAVFEEFGIDDAGAKEIATFVRERSPRAGLVAPYAE